MNKLILSSWSFHRELYADAMRLWDVPSRARGLGFEVVELQDLFLWPYGNRLLRWLRPTPPAPPDRDYDPALIRRIAAALGGMRCAVWDCDPDFGTDVAFDQQAYTRHALTTAARLGASVLRITINHKTAMDNLPAIIDQVAALLPHAKATGVRLAIENHATDTHAAHLIRLCEALDSFWVGVCLDFGNIASDEGFAALAPYAIHAHAKCYAFDANGQEPTIPYSQRMKALRDEGYTGAISIEYEGEGDPDKAIQQAVALLNQKAPGTFARRPVIESEC